MVTPADGPPSDVLIIGAGPTGLLLAGDLAAAGVACTLLERRDQESNLTRAFAVHARTLELLDACGLADALVATGEPVDAVRVLRRLDIDLSRLPTRFPYVLVTAQYHTERLLAERARALGVEIVPGAEVVGLRQDATGVAVEVRGDDGVAGTRRAAYAVGTDGAHSTVRRLVGLPFPGESVVRSMMLADVRLAEAPADVLTVNAVGDDFAFLAPFGDGWYRLIAWNRRHQLPDDAPVDLAELRGIARRALGTDYGMHDARWMSRFHSDERQVPRYRVGRVFLAGDAAHVHSPAGGQGMNTGLQDAANLAWKLAAAVHGWAGDELLDSYHAERYPVGRAVLRGSGALLRLVLAPSAPARVARGLLTGVVGRLGLVPPRLSRVVSGLAIAYPAPRGAHRLVGRRAPEVRLRGADGAPGRLYEALRSRRFVLVTGSDALAGVARRWAGRVAVVAPAEPTDTILLVRPDGYIAWAADAAAPGGLAAGAGAPGGVAAPRTHTHEAPPGVTPDHVSAALRRWCGPPGTPRAGGDRSDADRVGRGGEERPA
jgi:2-polyprenyl-6-methoxyphenol hydroxylase-like FAD-dependent oxidoreductase